MTRTTHWTQLEAMNYSGKDYNSLLEAIMIFLGKIDSIVHYDIFIKTNLR